MRSVGPGLSDRARGPSPVNDNSRYLDRSAFELAHEESSELVVSDERDQLCAVIESSELGAHKRNAASDLKMNLIKP